MKKKSTPKGLMLTGSLRKSGVTMYQRGGKVIVRTATSIEKRSNTLGQFIQRQKMRHTIALWKMLSFCDVMFTQRQTTYQNFASLANRLPAMYVPKWMSDASFLISGIPMSDGTLPTVKQQLGEVNGVPALITNLKAKEWIRDERLLFYTAEQDIEHNLPRVRFSMCELTRPDMTVVDGYLALVGEEFADEMKGWALVQVIGERCSPQTIVTRCNLYQQYATEEALQTAAKSYGGLTKTPF